MIQGGKRYWKGDFGWWYCLEGAAVELATLSLLLMARKVIRVAHVAAQGRHAAPADMSRVRASSLSLSNLCKDIIPP